MDVPSMIVHALHERVIKEWAPFMHCPMSHHGMPSVFFFNLGHSFILYEYYYNITECYRSIQRRVRYAAGFCPFRARNSPRDIYSVF